MAQKVTKDRNGIWLIEMNDGTYYTNHSGVWRSLPDMKLAMEMHKKLERIIVIAEYNQDYINLNEAVLQ